MKRKLAENGLRSDLRIRDQDTRSKGFRIYVGVICACTKYVKSV